MNEFEVKLHAARSRANAELAEHARSAGEYVPVMEGDIFFFKSVGDLTLEWVVVRQHVDDPKLFLLVPMIRKGLVGPADVEIYHPYATVWAVYCGEALWVPATACPVSCRIDALNNVEALRAIKHKLFALARGQNDPGQQAQNEAEYASRVATVKQARGRLLALSVA